METFEQILNLQIGKENFSHQEAASFLHQKYIKLLEWNGEISQEQFNQLIHTIKNDMNFYFPNFISFNAEIFSLIEEILHSNKIPSLEELKIKFAEGISSATEKLISKLPPETKFHFAANLEKSLQNSELKFSSVEMKFKYS